MNQQFNKGLLLTSLGSFWWGFIGVIYFKYLDFIGYVEVIIHRCVWTAASLILTTFFFLNGKFFLKLYLIKKLLLLYFFQVFLYLLIGRFGFMLLLLTK